MISRRGLFGLAAAVPFIPMASVARDTSWTAEEMREEAERYEQEEALEDENDRRSGTCRCRAFWYNRDRGYGYLVETPHHGAPKIYVAADIAESHSMEPWDKYEVSWRLTAHGRTAHKLVPVQNG